MGSAWLHGACSFLGRHPGVRRLSPCHEKIAAISWAYLQSALITYYFDNGFIFWKTAGVYLKIHFAKLSVCQSIVIYCDAKLSKLTFPKYQVASCQKFFANSLIAVNYCELVSLCCIGSSFVGSTKSLLKDDGSTGTITVGGLSVSQSFYRFMLRDKGRCLQVLRFERNNTNGKQSNTIIAAQLFQTLHRHTVPIEHDTYQWHLFNLFDWTFYIVHLCLAFQTVEMQNPKHDCMQLPQT